MHNENWDDLRFVLAVAEEGSVSAAARALSVNHATVIRRVAAFEERHGVSLFEKTARGYSIPADRIHVIEAIRQVELAMSKVNRLVQGRAAPVGSRVRVTSTDTFSLAVLPDILAQLTRERSEIRFELLTTNGHLDFSRLLADITVRPAMSLPEDLSGEIAAHLSFAVYGLPGASGWLALRGALAGTVAGKWMDKQVAPEDTVAGADSFPILARLAEAGIGRAVLPCVLGDASPRLVRSEDGPTGLAVPIWVASHSDLKDAPRLKAIRRAIADSLAKCTGLSAGN